MKSEVQKHTEREVLSQIQKSKEFLCSSLITVKKQNLGGTIAADLQAVIDDLIAVEAAIKAAYIAG
jgi:hypothetical protein